MVHGHKYGDYNRKGHKAISLFFVIFYAVGIIGTYLSFTFPLFLKLIPFALIVSFVALVFYHSSNTGWKCILVFLSIYIFSFTVEAIGVNTGRIFGYYMYGNVLGLKLYETPLIIGLNWLFLVYTTSAVVERWKLHTIFKILVASLGMLVYDIVLEHVAPKLDMWHWKKDIIPFQNYLAWFVLALIFLSILKFFNIKIHNRLAMPILLCQFLYFLILLILFKLT